MIILYNTLFNNAYMYLLSEMQQFIRNGHLLLLQKLLNDSAIDQLQHAQFLLVLTALPEPQIFCDSPNFVDRVLEH